MRPRAYQPTIGLISICPQTEVKYYLARFRDDHDYCYKSVTTQISYDTGRLCRGSNPRPLRAKQWLPLPQRQTFISIEMHTFMKES